MSDSEESVFSFDIDEGDISLSRPEKSRKYERACALTLRETWHCSNTTVGAARIGPVMTPKSPTMPTLHIRLRERHSQANKIVQ